MLCIAYNEYQKLHPDRDKDFVFIEKKNSKLLLNRVMREKNEILTILKDDSKR